MKRGIAIALVVVTVIVAVFICFGLIMYCISEYDSGYSITWGDPSICNCAMVVAHPDDETMFGGRTLLHSPPDYRWHVVVMTNARNETRVNELARATSHFPQVKAVTVLDNKDSRVYYNFPFLWKGFSKSSKERVKNIVNGKRLVVGHNEKGEYGHIQHKGVHKLLKGLDSLVKFGYFQFGSHNLIERELVDALEEYSSEIGSIKKHRELTRRSVVIN